MQIVLHKRFKRRYKKLRALQKQIDERLFLFAHNPFHPILNNHALIGKYKNYRSINITGDYRALYEPIARNKAFFVIVDTHSNLYK
ncbi:MAG: type II toxin-antitoxin system mRNA interferase toxin, RelE/StbE family [Candidatus Doudnabacteria bacterium]|nr:type II toxin-antitoxin system mRNA interferase toxin, RelE/StbE family [Candidatus Doudnabacteria bacterium]